MQIDQYWLQHAIGIELEAVSDPRVTARIHGELVTPILTTRTFPFSSPPSDHACWIVLADRVSDLAIVYAATGFGPHRPWGILRQCKGASMGADDDWHYTFLEAWLDAFPPIDLAIWRIVRRSRGLMEFVSDRGAWQEQWETVKRIRGTTGNEPYHTVDTDVFPRQPRSRPVIAY